MTLQEIVTQFRSIINELDANNSHFSDSQAYVLANEAIRFIVTRLEELPISWSTITAALGDITISSDTLLINEAYILNPDTNKKTKLEVTDFGYLKHISPTWLSDEASDPKYLVRKGNYAVYLYPQPRTAYIGQSIDLAGVSFPTELSAASDVPVLPKHTHDWIPHYMAFRAFQQLNMADKATSELILVQGLIKSTKNVTTKFSQDNDQWRIGEDNE